MRPILSIACAILLATVAPRVVDANPVELEVRVATTLPEMRAFADDVDKRLKSRQWEVVNPERKAGVAATLKQVRARLAEESRAAEPSAELVSMVGRLAGQVIEAEEGGITCKLEKRIGSNRAERVCYTQRRLDEMSEQARRSQHRLGRDTGPRDNT